MPKVNTDNILGKPPGHRSVDQDYELGKVLGKGAFGTVRLATSRTSSAKLACKSIAKAKLVCREDVQDVQREVAIMNHVAGHANVVNSKVRRSNPQSSLRHHLLSQEQDNMSTFLRPATS
jgi:serine/threonine protein kinase